jgi:GTPase-associated protein 1, N-terminal domain type 2/GTPase-associated protein 1, middle domain
MVIQQQYYTSWHNLKTQRTGFQVKAESSGITPEITEILNKIIGYSIPSQKNVSDIETHPIAFRYYVNQNIGVLLCSQSNGKDELGRDGNFFAHSIVGKPDEISYPLAPIFYWKSPFWTKKDESDKITLPPMEQFDGEVIFDFDYVWKFINEGKRKQWFYKLLCAVIDNYQSQRRIIILDDDDSIALWIATISTVFPPIYSRFLSFSTYHHDPVRAPFLITGTTSNSNFRCTSDAYISYFVLNTYEENVSEAPTSDYANYILERLHLEQYEDEILSFFNWLERLDSQQFFITHNLDNYVNFYQAAITKSAELETNKLVAAIGAVIEVISKKETVESEDIADVRDALKVLNSFFSRQFDNELVQQYNQCLQIIKKHDRNFANTFLPILNLLTLLVIEKRQQDASIISNIIAEYYPISLNQSTLNQPEYIQNWANQLQDNDLEQVAIFWQFFGKDFLLTEQTRDALQAILTKTFTSLQHQVSANLQQAPLQLSPNTAKVIATIRDSKGISRGHNFLLNAAVEHKRNSPTSPVLEWLYYALVENLTLQERSQHFWKYLDILKKQAPNLDIYELQRDLLKCITLQKLFQTISNWSEMFQDSRAQVINDAVTFLWSPDFLEFSTFNKRQIAVDLITEESFIQYIDQALYSQIVEFLLSQATICKLDSATLKVYEKLLPQLSYTSWELQYQSIMRGAIDLTNRILRENTAIQLYRYFEYTSSEKYEQEVKQLFEEFFAKAHVLLVRAVYIPMHKEVFWKNYWLHFQSNLLDNEQIIPTVIIMDSWLKESPDNNINKYYPNAAQEFLLEFASAIKTIQFSKKYRKIEKDFKVEMKRKIWYKNIEQYFQKSRKNFLGNFFNH